MAREDDTFRDLLAQGRKIEAIRLYRESHPTAGLQEAKEAVEAIARGEAYAPKRSPEPSFNRGPQSAPGSRAGAQPSTSNPTAGLDADIQAEIEADRKIIAIKIYRERYGGGLKEAKDIIEAHMAASGIPGKRGCFIATAAFGDTEAPEVAALRRLRDERLLPCRMGSIFVRIYYRLSPPAANWLAAHPVPRKWVRTLLRAFIRTAAEGRR